MIVTQGDRRVTFDATGRRERRGRMGKHADQDTPRDGGSGGSAGTDGDKPNDHGSELFPESGPDGEKPER